MTSSCILMSICVLIYVNKLKKLFFRFCRMNKFKSVLLFFKICIFYYLYFIFNKDCCCHCCCCCCIFYQCLNICIYLTIVSIFVHILNQKLLNKSTIVLIAVFYPMTLSPKFSLTLSLKFSLMLSLKFSLALSITLHSLHSGVENGARRNSSRNK